MELELTPRPNWDQEILHLAFEAFEGERAQAEPAHELERGLALAEQITRVNSQSFYLASGLLPREKRRAARVLYAFCRVTDDMVDEGCGDSARPLAEWRERALAPHPPEGDPLLRAWHVVRIQHGIPLGYARQLIEGIGMDLQKFRYATFEELATYCYGVASTVGLMAMHIIGFRGRSAIPYAVKLGVALQLTNILRDVGQDAQQGRIYLPQEDLDRFGYTEADLHRGVIDARFRKLMDFQIARASALYEEAWPGIRLLSPDGRLAIAAAADLYRGILGKIVQNDYDVFTQRAHLGAAEKLVRLPGLWGRVRREA